MENVNSLSCCHEGCGKQPSFGLESGKALFCGTHKAEEMIDVRSLRCEHAGCTRQRKYGPELGKPIFCSDHKTADMEDLTCKRCKSDFCKTIVQRNHRDHCLHCFVHLFPDEEISRNYKVKEKSVRDFIEPWLKGNFPDLETSFDKAIAGGCSAKRPDQFVDALTHCVFGEVDEEGHNSGEYCSCENKRMMLLMKDVGSRPVVFLRLNPDAYTDAHGVRHKSPFKRTKTGKLVIADKQEWQRRLELYRSRMEYHLTTVPEQEVQIEHLFYDGFL